MAQVKELKDNKKSPAKEKITKSTKVEKEVSKNGTTKKSDKTQVKASIKEQEVNSKKTQIREKIEKSDSTKLTAIDKEQEVTDTDKKSVAKAGKRSTKALKESEEKLAKEQRKTESSKHSEETDQEPKMQQKPARSRLERKSKKFRKVAELIEKGKLYNLSEAMELITKTSPVKFDATVEMHIRLGVDPKQADQNIRDMVSLPGGTGKIVRVAVFADADNISKAKKAGADLVGGDEFLQQLDKGKLDFDILIATPANMPKLGKYARILGPKGLMPNPKSGSVTNDVVKAVTEAKAGRVEYRVDSTGIVHLGIGKVSFGGKKLADNATSVLASVKSNKPASLKGNYMRSIHVTSSMGPSIAVELSNI